MILESKELEGQSQEDKNDNEGVELDDTVPF